MSKTEKFLIIDGNSIMNRAFYGLGSFKMKSLEGLHTNGVFGFLNIYWMILDTYKPEYVAVSFDLRAPTFRHKMYEDYKATRKGMPDELREQMPVIKEVLKAMTVPIIELEGYEADDVLGTVACINEKNNIFTYILTGDKDALQLVADNTNIIIPTSKMGKTEYTVYDKEMLKEKQGILPYQVIHIKSLMGDSSDNIPGVKGIGEKTAYTLIGKYETLENIYDNIDTLEASEKIKEKLLNDKEMAYMSKELATIDVHVPFELDYNHCRLTDVNKEELFTLFKKLNFNKFLSKYDFSSVEDSLTSQFEDEQSEKIAEFLCEKVLIVNSRNLDEGMREYNNMLASKEVSYYINTEEFNEQKKDILALTGIAKEDEVFCIYSNELNKCIFFDMSNIKKQSKIDYEDILKKFVTSNTNKIGFNIKPDLVFFFSKNLHNITNFSFDLIIAYYLMDSNKTTYDIEDIFQNLYSISFKKQEVIQEEATQISFFDDAIDSVNTSNSKNIFTNSITDNICIYLKGLFMSKQIVLEKLKELEMLTLFEDIEMPLVETLSHMEYVGMYIDLDKLNKFDIQIIDTIKRLEGKIYELAGEEFNINSPKVLGDILFKKLALPVVRKNKTGYSTDKEVLEKLMDKHEIIEYILEYRQVMKLKTTYVDGLRSKVAKDGRIHTTFMQTVSSTGRLSSTEPNLQNIPIRLDLGSKIREFFVAEDNNLIVDADYSQIELRVLAHISKDETMITAFKNNIDIHTMTASQVFGVPIEKVDKTLRSHAKAVNFGIVYGISEFGLAKNIQISRSEASEYISNYLKKYNGIDSFMKNIVKEATETGYVTTLFNRRRYIPELKQKNKNIVQFGERIAMNTPIQGTAADIIKIAMNEIYKELKTRNLKSRLIMQVHDELIIEADPSEIDLIKDIMYDKMEHVISLDVPLNIDLNIAKSWYDAK